MAYVNMASRDEQHSCYVDPRISFSNDLGDPQLQTSARHHHEEGTTKYEEAPVSSDFEFDVKNYTMMISADQIFLDGVLLPLNDESPGRKHERKSVTLREELTRGEHCCGDVSKSSNWWKLGFMSKRDPNKNESFRVSHGIVATKSQDCLARILE